MLLEDLPTPFFGACGVEGCTECWPLYDAHDNPIPDTEDGVLNDKTAGTDLGHLSDEGFVQWLRENRPAQTPNQQAGDKP